MPTPTSELSAVVFVDMVGAHQYGHQLLDTVNCEDPGSWVETLIDVHNGRVFEAIRKAGVTSVHIAKQLGDGMMLQVSSASDALKLSVEVQKQFETLTIQNLIEQLTSLKVPISKEAAIQALEAQNKDDGEASFPVATSIGIAWGEVQQNQEAPSEGLQFNDPVNYRGTPIIEAARLAELAQPGQVLMSRGFRDELTDKDDDLFDKDSTFFERECIQTKLHGVTLAVIALQWSTASEARIWTPEAIRNTVEQIQTNIRTLTSEGESWKLNLIEASTRGSDHVESEIRNIDATIDEGSTRTNPGTVRIPASRIKAATDDLPPEAIVLPGVPPPPSAPEGSGVDWVICKSVEDLGAKLSNCVNDHKNAQVADSDSSETALGRFQRSCRKVVDDSFISPLEELKAEVDKLLTYDKVTSIPKLSPPKDPPDTE